MSAHLAPVGAPTEVPDPIKRLHDLAELYDVGIADRARDAARAQLDRARDSAVGNLAEIAEATDALDEIDPDAEPGEPLAERIRRLAGTRRGGLRAV